MQHPQRHRYLIAYGILVALLLVLLVLNLRIGSVDVPMDELAAILSGRETGTTAAQIITTIRLPRMIAAAMLGGALAVAGFLLQTFFNNPIAGPFVLGISSGAKLTVALAMILGLRVGIHLTSGTMILAAFVGAGLSMALILLISGRVSRMSVLVVCGVMIGYICSAITDLIVTFAEDSNIVSLHNWSKGSYAGTSWDNVATMVPVVVIAMLLAFLLSKPMSAYQLGERYAMSLGVNLRALRLSLILLSSILAATVTAFAGPISFLGIAAPHLIRQLLGTERPILMIPGCYLGGAVFCLFCDLLARTICAPTELSISTVTAIFGAPVVIYMMLHRQRGRAL